MKKLFSILVLSVFLLMLNAQPSADAILKQVGDNWAKINNYSADVLIKVDVETIKIKDRKAKVFYTKPNKFEFKAEGFLLLPKKSGQADFMALLTQKSNAIYVKEELINNVKTHFLKIIPIDPNSEVVLAEVWIDKLNPRLVKMKTYTRQSGSYIANFLYSTNPFNLPTQIIIEFELKAMKLPGKMSGDLEELNKQMQKKGSKGKVTMIYSNYKVNQ